MNDTSTSKEAEIIISNSSQGSTSTRYPSTLQVISVLLVLNLKLCKLFWIDYIILK